MEGLMPNETLSLSLVKRVKLLDDNQFEIELRSGDIQVHDGDVLEVEADRNLDSFTVIYRVCDEPPLEVKPIKLTQ
jgi:hypothetical protein